MPQELKTLKSSKVKYINSAVQIKGKENAVYDIDIDADGRIHVFSLSGDHVSAAGSLGAGDGEFLYITNLAIDKKGYVCTVEEGSNRIQRIDFKSIVSARK